MSLPQTSLWRMMYLRKDYQAVCSSSDDLQGLVVAPFTTISASSYAQQQQQQNTPPSKPSGGSKNTTGKGGKNDGNRSSGGRGADITGADSDTDDLFFCDTSAETVDIWKGTIFVRSQDSPWFGGAFAFTITFPSGYPFECPVVTFDQPLPSHPMLLNNGTVLPFDEEHAMLDPMTCSILARLLRFIRRIFTPGELQLRGLRVDANRTRRDVAMASVKAAGDANTNVHSNNHNKGETEASQSAAATDAALRTPQRQVLRK